VPDWDLRPYGGICEDPYLECKSGANPPKKEGAFMQATLERLQSDVRTPKAEPDANSVSTASAVVEAFQSRTSAPNDIPQARLRVVVVGQGYVGLPLAMQASKGGHDVVGFDLSAEKVTSLAEGISYVGDVTDDELRQALSAGYCPSTQESSLREFDVAIIAVPTPLCDGAPDLSFVESATSLVARYLRPGRTVVLESTTYPGTTEDVVAALLSEISGLKPEEDFYLGFSPERVDPGNQVWTVANTPKIVSGVGPKSLERVEAFYQTIVERTVPVSCPRTAELAKIIENTFRQVNIALVNEMAIMANELGIDATEALDAAGTKPFGFMRFNPGPGTGGHCLPIDPAYLSWKVATSLGRTFRFIELANDINDHMPDYVVERVSRLLNEKFKPLNGSRVLVLGLAYKAGTGDLRESPALRIVKLLKDRGAVVSIADPYVEDWPGAPVVSMGKVLEVAAGVDIVVLATDHPEFDYDALSLTAPLIFDCRGRFATSENVDRL
jgi:UDP-N-acetyl-D-glucosamine dehydrogenase